MKPFVPFRVSDHLLHRLASVWERRDTIGNNRPIRTIRPDRLDQRGNRTRRCRSLPRSTTTMFQLSIATRLASTGPATAKRLAGVTVLPTLANGADRQTLINHEDAK